MAGLARWLGWSDRSDMVTLVTERLPANADDPAREPNGAGEALPAYLREIRPVLRRIADAESSFAEAIEGVREPTSDEVGEEIDLPSERLRELLAMRAQPMSLETPLGAEQDIPLGDLVADERAVDPEEAAQQEDLRGQLEGMLDSLGGRERQVIELHYGLDGAEDRTISQIGDALGVSRERIRQIEAKALRKLRHLSRPNRSRALAR